MLIKTNGMVFLFLLSSCSQVQENKEAAKAYDGYLAKVDDQLIRISETEKEKYCGPETFCEPNYVYYASFGKKRPPAPQPMPQPIPTFTPAPQPTPSSVPSQPPTSETLDYAKKIMQVEDAWKISKGNHEIVVAIVDTGVEVTHPDLRNNIFVNKSELNGVKGVDDDGNGYLDDVYGYDFVNKRGNGIDDNNHGTHVAGIIGAELNGIGVIGVSPKVKMMPLKFLNSQGSGDSLAAIQAIEYAIKNGANIISNSWGGGGYSQNLNNTIQKAVSAGIVVLAAAGNEASDNDKSPSYPAGYPNVVSVGSSDEGDQLSLFSNFGKKSVTVLAPGSNILSSLLGGVWGKLSGTSMATPQVAGAIALALGTNAKLTSHEVTDLICQTSDAILLSQVKCGRLNVGKFILEVSKR